MEDVLFFLILVVMVVITQALVIFIRDKTHRLALALLPNLGLLGIGLVLSIIGYVVAMGEPGSWAGLGFIILLMVTFITTGISTLTSLALIFVIKPRPQKPIADQSQLKKKTSK